jgi:hypothetical protein
MPARLKLFLGAMRIASTAGIVWSVGDVKKYALRMPLKQPRDYQANHLFDAILSPFCGILIITEKATQTVVEQDEVLSES